MVSTRRTGDRRRCWCSARRPVFTQLTRRQVPARWLNGRENPYLSVVAAYAPCAYILIHNDNRLTAREGSSLSLPFREPIVRFEESQGIGLGASALGSDPRAIGPASVREVAVAFGISARAADSAAEAGAEWVSTMWERGHRVHGTIGCQRAFHRTAQRGQAGPLEGRATASDLGQLLRAP